MMDRNTEAMDSYGDYDNEAVAPAQWKSGNWLNDYFRRFDELHVEKEMRLEQDIANLRKELVDTKASFDSPENIAALRNEMHRYRRECDEVLRPKLKEAEAFIEQQKQANDGQAQIIKDLMRRCKELETEKDVGIT